MFDALAEMSKEETMLDFQRALKEARAKAAAAKSGLVKQGKASFLQVFKQELPDNSVSEPDCKEEYGGIKEEIKQEVKREGDTSFFSFH